MWNGALFNDVKVLLRKGANPNIVDANRRTPLYWAVTKGHKNVVEILLKAEANPNIVDVYKSTPLHLAAINGHVNVVKTLLRVGVDPNKTDEYGHTPLHIAAERKNADVAEMLLRAGANIPEDLKDDEIVRGIQNKILAEKAFCRGLHERLGEESPVQMLNGFTEITQFMCNPDGKKLP